MQISRKLHMHKKIFLKIDLKKIMHNVDIKFNNTHTHTQRKSRILYKICFCYLQVTCLQFLKFGAISSRNCLGLRKILKRFN